VNERPEGLPNEPQSRFQDQLDTHQGKRQARRASVASRFWSDCFQFLIFS
jgi:hypothetical protein